MKNNYLFGASENVVDYGKGQFAVRDRGLASRGNCFGPYQPKPDQRGPSDAETAFLRNEAKINMDNQ
jgi:hypothetical protein